MVSSKKTATKEWKERRKAKSGCGNGCSTPCLLFFPKGKRKGLLSLEKRKKMEWVIAIMLGCAMLS